MSGRGNPARVLLVDDDPDFIGRARTALESVIHLRTAHSGRSALSLVSFWQPDVVLLDILLNDVDGFTFLEQLSEVGIDRLPFILYTTDGRGANTRVRPLPNWRVGTVQRSSTTQQLRAAVVKAVRCQDEQRSHCIVV
jgi:CheY-like chemotaxis protein